MPGVNRTLVENKLFSRNLQYNRPLNGVTALPQLKGPLFT